MGESSLISQIPPFSHLWFKQESNLWLQLTPRYPDEHSHLKIQKKHTSKRVSLYVSFLSDAGFTHTCWCRASGMFEEDEGQRPPKRYDSSKTREKEKIFISVRRANGKKLSISKR